MILQAGIALAGLPVVLLALVHVSSAGDADVVLSGPAPVRIWKSQSAMEKAQDLLAESDSHDAIRSLLVCEVSPGTRATVTRAEHSYAWDVEVTEGPALGCRGVVGPRDFKTVGELAARPPAKAFPEGQVPASPPTATVPPEQPDSRMILWYQFYELAHDGSTQTVWKSVAGWETTWQCDAARRRLANADEQEVRRILDRFEVLSRNLSGRVTLSHTPREYGLDLEVNVLTRQGRRTMNLEVRSYCFPATYDPHR